MDCLFCRIVAREVPAEIILEEEDLLCFKDIQPQAPVHLLIIPKKHIATLNETEDEDQKLLGKMILTAKALAKKLNIAEKGYRLVFNINSGGGQAVYHIHLHILGGRQMTWPPG